MKRKRRAKEGLAGVGVVALMIGVTMGWAVISAPAEVTQSNQASEIKAAEAEVKSTEVVTKTNARELVPALPGAEHYQVVIERNMFVRRSSSRNTSEGNGNTQPTTPVSPAAFWQLTGTIWLGEQQTALLENLRDGQVLRVVLNEALPTGKLVGVEADCIVMEVDGERRKVALGEKLDPQATSIAAQAGAGGASNQGGTNGQVNGEASRATEEMSLLERMRARRQQELNR